MGNIKIPLEEVLLREYSEAQNSARHHDKLLWVVTSIIISGMIILIGQIVACGCEIDKLIITYVGFFGIILCFALLYFAIDFRRIKNFHYDRCKEIANNIQKNYGDNRIMKQPSKGEQWYVYLLVIILLIQLWVIILLTTWHICF